MSVAFTADHVIARTKTVTRRAGWWRDKNGRQLLHAGDKVTLCAKVMGRRNGEPLERLAEVEIIDVRRERLAHVDVAGELALEGFPYLSATEFIQRYFEPQGIHALDLVTRIQWSYLDEVTA